MKKRFVPGYLLAPLAAAPEEKVPKQHYDQKGQRIRPADYPEWMFLPPAIPVGVEQNTTLGMKPGATASDNATRSHVISS
jgi:hypothetical protein